MSVGPEAPEIDRDLNELVGKMAVLARNPQFDQDDVEGSEGERLYGVQGLASGG